MCTCSFKIYSFSLFSILVGLLYFLAYISFNSIMFIFVYIIQYLHIFLFSIIFKLFYFPVRKLFQAVDFFYLNNIHMASSLSLFLLIAIIVTTVSEAEMKHNTDFEDFLSNLERKKNNTDVNGRIDKNGTMTPLTLEENLELNEICGQNKKTDEEYGVKIFDPLHKNRGDFSSLIPTMQFRFFLY